MVQNQRNLESKDRESWTVACTISNSKYRGFDFYNYYIK